MMIHHGGFSGYRCTIVSVGKIWISARFAGRSNRVKKNIARFIIRCAGLSNISTDIEIIDDEPGR